MTTVQINYQNMLETKQHNRATEEQAKNELAETKRHNIAYETETNRHNVVSEKETNRHNVVTEREASRHNLATEVEANRHNVATENETHRTNVANEQLKADSNAIAREKNRIERIRAEAQAAQAYSTAKLNNWVSDFRSKYPETAALLYIAKESGGKIFSDVTAAMGLTTYEAESIIGTTSVQEVKRVMGKKTPAQKQAIANAYNYNGIKFTKNASGYAMY